MLSLRNVRQKSDQTLEDFKCTFIKLSKDCSFSDVLASVYQEDFMRDVFIYDIGSPNIRQRLLEHKILMFAEAFE